MFASLASMGRRRRRLLVTLCLAGALLTALVPARRVVARPADVDAPVDLAALLIGVRDLEDYGLDGMLPLYTRDQASVDDFITSRTWTTERESRQTRDTLAANGFMRHVDAVWADADAIGHYYDGDGYAPRREVSLYAFQYDTAAHATKAFTALEAGDIAVPDFTFSLGDQSDLNIYRTSYDGGELSGADASTRLGALTFGVRVIAQPSDPLIGSAPSLATQLLTYELTLVKGRSRLPTSGPGLDAPHFAMDPLDEFRSSYLVRDGQSIFAYRNESKDKREQATADLVATGVISQYETGFGVATEELVDASFPTYTVFFRVTTYDTASHASARLDDPWADRRAAGLTVTEVQHVPPLGDRVAAAQIVNADSTDYNTVLMWSQDTTVYMVRIELPNRTASMDALLTLGLLQVDCVAAANCWQPQAFPPELQDDMGPTISRTPAAATPEPGSAPETTPKRGLDSTGVGSSARLTWLCASFLAATP